ncbi:hypothetical protein I305_01045 [Cryptococcus gattii E566]|uniref:Uncharacterized protein n=2 Tax=Cryptococcus gattii TaxID=37769 RepID=E6R0H7_CRYGW|nr:Hypothetical protein CGB_B3350W [Cryptococcus gattii WM276]ADV20315.1 Hypothetical protein CGB_B3350W [Cryptococcus gattii WM276]KIR77190.1 hypothetical protein I306_05846 [Cryptococcus gattii EJB2]KIY36189.1 hypothetical protein I305_01045 [Cryptococcus gattii E566]KJE06161.1 hypothetical protein I311_00302 [Cryptococcus gattii NT-10]
MAIEIGRLEIAAIASAGIALVLVIFVSVIYLVRKKSRRKLHSLRDHRSVTSTAALSGSHQSEFNRETFTTFGFGATGLASLPHIQAPTTSSPSTAQTLLMTLTNSSPNGKKQKLTKVLRDIGSCSAESGRRNTEELVVITYEDGLRKLGIDPNGQMPRPQHILYPEEYHDNKETAMFEPQIDGRVDSPRAKSGRDRGAGRVAPPALESTWLPSYYHLPNSGQINDAAYG